MRASGSASRAPPGAPEGENGQGLTPEANSGDQEA